jgi:hypothetical protein
MGTGSYSANLKAVHSLFDSPQRRLACSLRRGSNRGSIAVAVGGRLKMGIEEQKEEREVLDSIFPEEITGFIALIPK